MNEAQLRNADQQSQINAMQITQGQNAMADDATMRANRAGALAGDPNATAAMAAINPEVAAKYTDFLSGLDEKGRAAALKSVDEAGKLANYVLTAPDPKAAYAEALTLLPKDIRAKAPPEYDEGWVKTQLALATALHAMNPAPLPDAASPAGKVAQDARNGILTPDQAAAGIQKEVGADPSKKPTPYTDIGKAQSDLDNGLISPDQYDKIVLKGPEDGGKGFDNEKDLAAQYSSLSNVKTFQTIRDNYDRITSSAKNARENTDDSGAADISMIFAYMKMLDPTSVVREGEFATAENAGGVGQSVMNLYNKLVDGGRLTEKVRTSFERQAKNIYGDAEKHLGETNDQFKKRAEKWGVDPSNFLVTPSKSAGDIPSITDDAGYDALPSGAIFIDPNGKKRKKP